MIQKPKVTEILCIIFLLLLLFDTLLLSLDCLSILQYLIHLPILLKLQRKRVIYMGIRFIRAWRCRDNAIRKLT